MISKCSENLPKYPEMENSWLIIKILQRELLKEKFKMVFLPDYRMEQVQWHRRGKGLMSPSCIKIYMTKFPSIFTAGMVKLTKQRDELTNWIETSNILNYIKHSL